MHFFVWCYPTAALTIAVTVYNRLLLKENIHDIMSYIIDHRPYYRLIEGKLKIIPSKDRKAPKSYVIINHKGIRMVKDGED